MAIWEIPVLPAEDFGHGGDRSEDDLLRECNYLGGRGPMGEPLLRKIVDEAEDAEWVRRIPVQSAVMNGHVASTLRYLVEEVGVETLDCAYPQEPPLHMAAIWGRTECAAYLLAHGAEPLLQNAIGQTAADKARIRQQRLQAKLSEDIPWKSDGSCIGKEDISRMFEDGHALVDLLAGVEEAGSFLKWARKRRSNPLVLKFLPGIRKEEPRLELSSLRALVQRGRAMLRPREEREAMARAAAQRAAAGAATVAAGAGVVLPGGVPLSASLEVAMVAAGVGDLAGKLQQALGPFHSVGELCAADVTRGQLAACLQGSEAEQRRLWRFLLKLQEARPSGLPSMKGKGKGTQTSRALAALASAAPKDKDAAAADAGITKKRRMATPSNFVVGVELLFAEALPETAFILAILFLYG